MDAFAAALSAWLAFHESLGVNLPPSLQEGASEAELAQVEDATGLDLPDDLRALYRHANGQPSPFDTALDTTVPWAAMFGRYRFLPLDAALAEYRFWLEMHEEDGFGDEDAGWPVRDGDPVEPRYWAPSRFPFASDDNGNDLAVDLSPSRGGTWGQVIEFGADRGDVRVLASSVTELMSLGAARLDPAQPGRITREPASPGTDHFPPLPPIVAFDMDWREMPYVEQEPTARERAVTAEREAVESAFLVWLNDQGLGEAKGRRVLGAMHGEIARQLFPDPSPLVLPMTADDAFREYLLSIDTELYIPLGSEHDRAEALEALALLHAYRLHTGEWTAKQHARAEAVRLRERPVADTDSGFMMERTGFGSVIINGVAVEGSEID